MSEEEMRESVEDHDWMKEEGNQEFEGEVWLSTDGKNTVRVMAKTSKGREAGLMWAKLVYNRLLAVYGTKQSLTMKEAEKSGVVCATCGKPAQEKSGTSKTGKPYHGIFCTSEDKSHTKWLS